MTKCEWRGHRPIYVEQADAWYCEQCVREEAEN